MPMVKLSSKGQIVIPKSIRDTLKLKSKKPVVIELVGDHAEIRPMPDIINELRGTLKGKKSMTQALIREHEEEGKHNETVHF